MSNKTSTTDKEKVSNLLELQPLYKKIKVDVDFFRNPLNIEDLSFSFFCSIDNSKQTFKLNIEPNKLKKISKDKLSKEHFEWAFNSFDQNKSKHIFTQHYSATCQYCNEYKIDFLLKVETNIPIAISSLPDKENSEKAMQIVTKIGQFPPFEIGPNKDLIRFLNEEDQENYKKATICLSQNYGIGAFAYLRRIVENEMIRLVESLAEIDRPESKNIKLLLDSFRENHIMTKLIDGVYEYIPNSLKDLGDNPLKILYGQLSGGIHEFSEDECSAKASEIDIILKFVIKKINEETSEVLAAKEAMKNLK